MEPFRRNNFFTGRLLSADDLMAEQHYFLGKHRLHNRLFHGSGVVTGLRVTAAGDATAPSVTVGPGLALDPLGNEICVGTPAILPLPLKGSRLFVLLFYRESQTDPLPVVSGSGDGDSTTMPSRIEETFALVLAPTLPPKPSDPCGAVTPEAAGVPLARLVFSRRRWRIDRRFRVPRAR